MKKLFLLSTILLLSLSAKCDTLDFWQVYINDEIVAEFNVNSKNFNVKLKKSKLNVDDTLTVRYYSCVHCVDCTYGLTMLAEIKRSAPKAITSEHFGKLSIPIKELLDIKRTEKIKKFPFYFYQKSKTDKIRKDKRIFVLSIE